MIGRSFTVALILSAVALAGCTTDEAGSAPMGTLAIAIVDDGPAGEFLVSGLYGHMIAGNSWSQPITNESIALTGSGDEVSASGAAKAGAYDLARVVFATVKADGVDLVMVRDGLDLPLGFNVTEGGTTSISIRFQWERAIYESADGMAFVPTLRSVKIVQDGATIVDQDAGEIVTKDPNAPVARMRVIDEVWQIWEADFIANDADVRKKGTAGNITFLGGASEAVATGAEIAAWDWTFEDGVVLSGQTVNRNFDLGGGNTSVVLEVTDTNGVTDDIFVSLALAPGMEAAVETFRVEGLTGVSATSGDTCTGSQTHTFAVDATMTPSGVLAGVSNVKLVMAAVAPHPQVDIDVALTDGGGSTVTQKTNNGGSANLNKNYDPAGSQPASGDWVVTVYPCKAVDITVNGNVAITWQGVGEPEFLTWYADYNDNENR